MINLNLQILLELKTKSGVYILPSKGHNGRGDKIRDFKKGEEKSG